MAYLKHTNTESSEVKGWQWIYKFQTGERGVAMLISDKIELKTFRDQEGPSQW